MLSQLLYWFPLHFTLVLFSNIFQLYCFLLALSYFITTFWGLPRLRRRKVDPGPLKRFAVVLPAYNEAAVIGYAIESLKKLDYPAELFDIYLVADHCTDRTCEIARQHGILVFEHAGDDKPRGKGYALRAFDKYAISLNKYDAFCYFDADSLAHPGFLKAMSERLNAGEKAIQGFERAKNPGHNLLTRICHVSQSVQNYFQQIPKHKLGLNATLHGKGMCFTPDLMEKYPWDGACLTEDIEMQARLTRHGVRITFAPEALVYDEVPSELRPMILRSIRWTKGSLQVARKHLAGLARRAFAHKDKRAFEQAARFSMCYRFLMISFMVGVAYLYKNEFNILFWIFDHPPGARFTVKLMNWIPIFLYPAIALRQEKASFSYYITYLIMPLFYLALGIPVFFYSLASYRRKAEWYRTDHSSHVNIGEVMARSNASPH